MEVHDGPADNHRLSRRPRTLPLDHTDAFWNEVDKMIQAGEGMAEGKWGGNGWTIG